MMPPLGTIETPQEMDGALTQRFPETGTGNLWVGTQPTITMRSFS